MKKLSSIFLSTLFLFQSIQYSNATEKLSTHDLGARIVTCQLSSGLSIIGAYDQVNTNLGSAIDVPDYISGLSFILGMAGIIPVVIIPALGPVVLGALVVTVGGGLGVAIVTGVSASHHRRNALKDFKFVERVLYSAVQCQERDYYCNSNQLKDLRKAYNKYKRNHRGLDMSFVQYVDKAAKLMRDGALIGMSAKQMKRVIKD
jgi:hypothetical protein